MALSWQGNLYRTNSETSLALKVTARNSSFQRGVSANGAKIYKQDQNQASLWYIRCKQYEDEPRCRQHSSPPGQKHAINSLTGHTLWGLGTTWQKQDRLFPSTYSLSKYTNIRTHSTVFLFSSFVFNDQHMHNQSFKDEAQTALFKDPVRTAL